jgi:hypothetical protein
MTTSPSPQAPSSSSSSNGASGASLSQWRLWLSTLNWRWDPGYEQRKIQHEQRMKKLRSKTEPLRQENVRLAAIEYRPARF